MCSEKIKEMLLKEWDFKNQTYLGKHKKKGHAKCST